MWQVSVQIITEFSENRQRKMWINARFHPLLLCEYYESVHGDKQWVALILQLGAIKPLQKKRVQRDVLIKRAAVKPEIV